MLRGEACTINGDGETSRDFCFVANAVQANLRAAYATLAPDVPQVYNVAVGDRTSLVQLHDLIAEMLVDKQAIAAAPQPNFAPFRAGDVRHSLANIDKARTQLGFAPTHDARRHDRGRRLVHRQRPQGSGLSP